MYRFHAPQRLAGLVVLALAAACGDGVTEGHPGAPGKPGTTPPQTTPAVASVEIDPATLQLRVETSRALSATLRSRAGTVVTGRTVTWTSSDSSVVRVDINGNVTALKVGTSVVTAAAEGKQGQSTIEVTPPPAVASVHVHGDVANLEPGESRTLGVQLRAASGEVLHDRQVAWSSSDSSVVRVLPGGTVQGVKGGTATITATSEGASGTLAVVIPPWLQFELQTISAQALPVVLETSADTTDRTEHGMVIHEYRQRLVRGRLWLSTTDFRYRQRYDVQLWKRTVTWFQGNAMGGPEELIQVRTIRDEGDAAEFDTWTGEPIYASTLFGGHWFRIYQTAGRDRVISQRIPGEGEPFYDLRFKK